MTWSDFETRLFEMITDLPSRTVLIIGARDDQGKTGLPFVQFAGLGALYGGNADIVAEICGKTFPKTWQPSQPSSAMIWNVSVSLQPKMGQQRGDRISLGLPRAALS